MQRDRVLVLSLGLAAPTLRRLGRSSVGLGLARSTEHSAPENSVPPDRPDVATADERRIVIVTDVRAEFVE